MSKWNSLHNHLRYSKLDSMLDTNEFIAKAKEYGMDAIGITDHGIMIGCIEFYQKCKKEKIKPILGIEIYLTEDMSIKTRKELQTMGYRDYHLILLAKDNEGLANLYQIASMAANDGQFDGNERIDLKYIRDNSLSDGIVCTSACIGGPISSYLYNSDNGKNKVDIQRARQWAKDLKDTFKDFYIELGCNNLRDTKIVNFELMHIAKDMDIPLVIAGDTHYLTKDDAKIHDILLCINTNSNVLDTDRFKFPSDEFYLLHPDQVEAYCIANNIPLEAMENTVKITDMCNVDPTPKDKKGLLPPFTVPNGFTEDTYLYKLAYDALIEVAVRKNIDYTFYSSRLAYELEVICFKGYAGYFLILWDLIKWCNDHNIMTGPGRGSAAGSLTAYLLRITTLDPMEHGLMFERFLDPEKDAFPDIDTDFEFLRRQEVIEYILLKYGLANVAQIITTNRMKLKGASGRIMKAFGMTSTEVKRISDMIPKKMPDQSDPEYSKFKDIIANPDKYKDEYGIDKFSAVYNKVKQFWEAMSTMPDVDYALSRLEGCVDKFSVHASGVVIAPTGKLMRALPTRKFESAPLPVCQFDMAAIDFIRALKLDVLGLKTLSVIDICCKLAGIDKNILNIENYDDYPEVYELIRNGLTKQVFQLGSPGMTKMIYNMEVSNFEELTDALALYRPGPLTARDENTGLTMVDTYIQSKKTGTITSLHPDIDSILHPTKGCLVYQEQLMKVAQRLSGYTLNQADASIRKPVGKKKIKEFPKIRQQFVYGDGKIPGAIAMGYLESFGNAIFDMIIKFGGLIT